MCVRRQHLAFLLLFVLPLAAQQGAAIFHHFHHYPTGQYTTRLQGTISGLPPGAPVTQTTCTAAPNPAQVAAAINVANSAAAMQNCTVRILHDEEKLAEYEQTCHNGPATQVIHHTMSVIDDRTFKEDTLSKVGPSEMSGHSTVHYDGPCTAAQLAEASHAAMPKPSIEECAEFVASKKEMANSAKSCEEVPAEYRGACTRNLQVASASLNQMLAACAK